MHVGMRVAVVHVASLRHGACGALAVREGLRYPVHRRGEKVRACVSNLGRAWD